MRYTCHFPEYSNSALNLEEHNSAVIHEKFSLKIFWNLKKKIKTYFYYLAFHDFELIFDFSSLDMFIDWLSDNNSHVSLGHPNPISQQLAH